MSRAIITFQLGSHANHTGAHWWNIQQSAFIYDSRLLHTKEIDNDILYRVGKNAYSKMETYTPRLLLYDVTCSTTLSNVNNNITDSDQNISDLSKTVPTSQLWSEEIETIDLSSGFSDQFLFNIATNQQHDSDEMLCEGINIFN